jgi:hypothetical protein
MTDCNNNVSIEGLPEAEFATLEDYLIVHNNVQTSKVKLSNFVIAAENVDFYPELIEMVAQLNSLNTFIQNNSANWDSTYTTVNTTSSQWNTTSVNDILEVKQKMDLYGDLWTSTYTTVVTNSASWSYSNEIILDTSRWDSAAEVVSTHRTVWDEAYAAAVSLESIVRDISASWVTSQT